MGKYQDMPLYKNIKKLRKEKGLSQTELAKLVGYSDKTMISHIENGYIDLSRSKIIDFAKALGVNPGYLMGWDVPKETEEELESKMVQNRLDFLFLEEDNIPELEQNQADFKKNKEDYERVKQFVKLFNNATPEAKTLVENFLKSSQQ